MLNKSSGGNKRSRSTPSDEELLEREAELQREEAKYGLDTPEARARETNERVRKSQAKPLPNGDEYPEEQRGDAYEPPKPGSNGEARKVSYSTFSLYREKQEYETDSL